MTTHDKLLHAITEHDRRERAKRYYNPNALGLYMRALHQADADTANGLSIRHALVANFCGSLLDKLLKAVGEAKSTDREQRQ
jgi:hypothetical protein